MKLLILGLAVILLLPASSEAQLVNQYTPCPMVLQVASMPSGESVPITRVVLCLVEELEESQAKIEDLEHAVQQLTSNKEDLENQLQQLRTDQQSVEQLQNDITVLQLQMSTVQEAAHIPAHPPK